MRDILQWPALLALLAMLAVTAVLPWTTVPAHALESRDITDAPAGQTAPRPAHPDAVPRDSAFTTKHWKQARAYHNAMRLELARQEYLLALSTCRTGETRDRLQRELQIVEMQLRTLR